MTINRIKNTNLSGTASDLSLANPVLEEAQIAVATDTDTYKIGNGVDNYNTLLSISTQLLNMDNVRKNVLDNPLVHILKKNKLVDTLAPDNLTSDLTWTRASTATYVDMYGVVRTAAIDEPRQEKDGWLIEGESTNSAIRSEDITAGAWALQTGATRSADTATAPDDNVTADTLTVTTTTNASRVEQSIALTDTGQDVTFSVFLKNSTVGSIKIRTRWTGGTTIDNTAILDLTTGQVTNETFTSVYVEALYNGWYRISGTTTGNSTNSTLNISVASNGIAGDVFVWGAQLEELPFASATSYIPTTTTAVTRSSDRVSFAALDNMPRNGFTILLKTAFKFNNNAYETAIDFDDTVSIRKQQTGVTFGNRVVGFLDDGTGTGRLVALPSNTGDINDVFAFVYDGVATKTIQYRDDETSSSVTDSAITYDTTQPVYVGSRFGTGRFLYGHISDLRIYDLALNSDEIQFLGQQ